MLTFEIFHVTMQSSIETAYVFRNTNDQTYLWSRFKRFAKIKRIYDEWRKIMTALHITTDTFESEVLNSDKPVLIDFWATWCGPCQMQGPIIDDMANELTDVKVCKVNVDENPDLAKKYRVMSIPNLVVIENGALKTQEVGVHDKKGILKMLGR